MPGTVKAKLLLGWMTQREALQALRSCVFDPRLNHRKLVDIWEEYRDKVAALQPRRPGIVECLPLSQQEQQAIEDHTRRIQAGPNARYFREVIKVHPADLLAKQFHVLIDRSATYGEVMKNEAARVNHCLGVGLNFKGPLVFTPMGPRMICVKLPHPEFVPLQNQTGIVFQERDRYITAVRTPDGRLLLWGGYHRTHGVLCHMAGDADGAAPLLTVMEGIPEVVDFFGRASWVREAVLSDRPALLRDFFDENLFMTVNLRKKRAEGRVEQIRPNQIRAGIFLLNDDT
jgi:hypothetical protein